MCRCLPWAMLNRVDEGSFRELTPHDTNGTHNIGQCSAALVAGETVSEEDQVVYLLASLPESYNVLVTALEANEAVPKLEVVTKCILHQERKSKEKSGAS